MPRNKSGAQEPGFTRGTSKVGDWEQRESFECIEKDWEQPESIYVLERIGSSQKVFMY
jgi:hypothetical protein